MPRLCPAPLRARRARGFTLTEIAVVLAIVGLLLGSMMLTFSAQVENRNRGETQRRLDEARELLLAFAVVNKRLPCPATASSGGDEVIPITAPGGGGACAINYPNASSGFLPARAIGFQPVDSAGFAIDGWNQRIRYAVSSSSSGIFTTTHSATAVWSLATTPTDLVVCTQAQAGTSCAAGQSVSNQNMVVAIVFSTGKNGAQGAAGTNESENLDGDAVFVYRAPDPSTAAGGEYDDLTAWIPVGLLYSRMISAAILP
jgi:prepilin-type N-terminal cleavage/methylation domain-containing protein